MTEQQPGNYALARSIMADLLEAYDNARRDEGAFPAGDRRAAMSEHRLWHAFNTARCFLKSPHYANAERTETEKKT